MDVFFVGCCKSEKIGPDEELVEERDVTNPHFLRPRRPSVGRNPIVKYPQVIIAASAVRINKKLLREN